MNEALNAKKVFEFLETELNAYKLGNAGELKLGAVESEDGEEIQQVVSWQYEPEDEIGLDLSILYFDNGYASIHIGPIHAGLEDNDPKTIRENILKTILMVANGQLKLVLTYDIVSKKAPWQAAELYLLGLEKHPTVLRVVSNHTRSARHLAAITLENSTSVDHQTISDKFWLLPERVNGKYPKGRELKLEKPTPLTGSIYKSLDTSLTIQALGGEAGEPFWSYFYRTTEFWLVTIPLGCLDFWIVDTYFNDDSWTSVLIKYAIHSITTAVVIFLTAKLLAWRRKRLDKDNVPRFERTEDMLTIMGVSRVAAAASVMALLFAPLWTPVGDFTNLFPGTKYVLTYPTLLIACVLMLAPLVFNKVGSFASKLLVSVAYGIGVGLAITTNILFMNNADNSPTPATPWFVLAFIIPVAIVIWMFYKTFAKPNPRDTKEWDQL